MANGFRTELWTTGRVALFIRKHFRVRFHRGHVAHVLHELGFKPARSQYAEPSSAMPRGSRTGNATADRR